MENIDLNNEKEEKNENEKLIDRMVEKSIEAVLLAIEIYNKPTIKYRTESFAFYICNAWELLIKAWLLKINKNIYKKNKNNEKKTISLSECMNKALSANSEVYKNIRTINTLRNISTHYVVTEYEDFYVGVFQSSIFNYVRLINKWFDRKLEEEINGNFVLIANINSSKNHTYLQYDKNTIEKLNEIKTSIKKNQESLNEYYSVNIIVNMENNNSIEKIVLNSNVQEAYPYRQKEAIGKIQENIAKLGLKHKFVQSNLTDLNKLFNLKQNKKYYCQVNPETNLWLCNQSLVQFITNKIKNDPNILEFAKNENKKKK